ncbi:MAG: FecR domain-containing protein [Pseudomonadota bacterium]
MRVHLAAARLVLVSVLSFLAVPGFTQDVGVAIPVARGAEIERPAGSERLRTRTAIRNGDAIVTDGTGVVQLLFLDETRVVLGPNTRFEIEDVSIGSGETPNFTVGILGGVFRFLSGKTPRSAYELRTPTATMGIRGTVFDVAVDTARRTTRLVTFDGTVRFCGARCGNISGGCRMVRTDGFGRLRPPKDKRERDAVLNTLFPFILDQAALSARYRARTERCGDIDPLLILAPVPSQAPARPRLQDRERRGEGGENSGRSGGGGGGGGGTGGGDSEPGKDEL